MSNYLKITAPTSNQENGVSYLIRYAMPNQEEKTITLYTVDDVQNAVSQIKNGGGFITNARRYDETAHTESDFVAETRQEQTDRENRDHCRHIAEDLEQYASGDAYKCPHCGEVHTMDEYEESEHEDKDGCTCYTCPNCGEEIEEDALEAVSLYDYFEDCLDIEYRVTGRARDALRSVCIMVACGGPNIYIDTATKNVELYWWGDRASYPLLSDTVDAVNDWAAEYWACL